MAEDELARRAHFLRERSDTPKSERPKAKVVKAPERKEPQGHVMGVRTK